MDFVVICGQSFFKTPVSGGDVLNFELLKRIDDSWNPCFIINDITASYAKENLKCEIFSIKDFFNLSSFVQKHIFLVPLAFVNSTIRITRILGKFKRPLILYSSGDFICNIFPMVIYRKKFRRSRIIVRIHHINENPFKRKGNSFLSSFLSFSLQRISFFLLKKNASLILLLNQRVKDSLVKLGFPSEKLVVIGAGVDLEKTRKTKSVNRENKIIFLARLSKTKGIFDLPRILLIVLGSIPDVKLVIMGMGNDATVNELKNEFKKANVLDKVEFKGFIKEKEEIYEIMSKSKMFILPSYEEGWGIVVFEAIACGLAPVVYDLPVFKEIFGNKISTSPLGDFSKFAEYIIYFLKHEEKRRDYTVVLNEKIKKYDTAYIYQKEINLIEKTLRQSTE